MMELFLWRALAGGIGVALVAGPLGCLVVWRRMAYFGDALAHGALLGVALGLALDLNANIAVLAVFILFSALLAWMQTRQRLATDTLLGILAHAALSAGLIGASFQDALRVDLLGYLFGDILAITWGDLGWIYGGGGAVLVALVALWPKLLALTVHEELAKAEGLPVARLRLTQMLLMALVIVLAMKVVGVLLITALLIIPAATARTFARTPEQMAVLSALLGTVAVTAGLGASLTWDTPSGPSVVAAAALLFAISLPLGRLLERRGEG